MKRVILAALAVVAMASCTEQNSLEGGSTTSTEQEIKFSSSIISRVSENKWEGDEQIGISATTYNDYNTDEESLYYPVTPYNADSAGEDTTFTVEDGYSPMVSPNNVYKIYIEAFYPFSIYNSEDDSRRLNISDQSDQSALDVLAAYSSFTSLDNSYIYVSYIPLPFIHSMSAFTFNITAKESISSLEGLSLEIGTVAIEANPLYEIEDDEQGLVEYGSVEGLVTLSDDKKSAVVNMILFPTMKSVDTRLTVTLNGTAYYATLSTIFNQCCQHTVNLTMGTDGVTIGDCTIGDWGDQDEYGLSSDLSTSEYDGLMTLTEFLALSAETLPSLPSIDKWTITGDATDEQIAYIENGRRFLAINDALVADGRTIDLIFNDITQIPNEIFNDCTAIESLSAPLATTIGKCSLMGCTALTSVNLPEVESAGYSCFESCSSLESISLPKLKELEEDSFLYCSSLKSVDIPLLESAGYSCFKSCTSLESIDIPLLESIGEGCFSGCSLLESINAPTVTQIGDSGFNSCSSLLSVEMPLLESIGKSCFSGCSRLASINTTAVTQIGEGGFAGCTSLKSVDIPLIESIEAYSFVGCSSLESINAPKVTQIGDSGFDSCPSLLSVDMPLLESIGADCFLGCSSLKSITSDSLTSAGSQSFLNCSSLESISLPKLTTLPASAFNNCSSLEKVDLPAATIFGMGVFINCNALTEMSVATNSGAKIESIGSGYFFGPPFNMSLTLTVGAANAEYVSEDDGSLYGVAGASLTINGYTQVFKEIIVLEE